MSLAHLRNLQPPFENPLKASVDKVAKEKVPERGVLCYFEPYAPAVVDDLNLKNRSAHTVDVPWLGCTIGKISKGKVVVIADSDELQRNKDGSL